MGERKFYGRLLVREAKMSASKSLSVIYDGHCGFCIRALNVVSALDAREALRFYDSHRPETVERFPELLGEDLEDAMYTIAENESPYRGFFAFRRIIWSNPLMWIFVPFFYFPGASFLGPRIYAWVARNRSRFGCRSEVCDLPSALPAKQSQKER